MPLPRPIYYTIVLLGVLVGAFTGWYDFNSDYDLDSSAQSSALSYIHDKIPITIPVPRVLTTLLTRPKKDRSILVGKSHGFKYVYKTADANRLTRSQRDLVRDAVSNYFDTHTTGQIDALIEEGDGLARVNAESWTQGTGTACLKLDDKWGPEDRWGPLEGYLKLGREDHFDEDVYCGPTFTLTIMRPQFTYAPAVEAAEGEVETQESKRPRAEDREL
ncbi:uncharacterized protein BDW70DRAFT_113284 [Aspergillus foveolatus]|uniref:uncharacterized protein n=1 Tax=Aspergillus foveolatus TaxID=210207 RepID=UPI003CCE2728